MSARTEVESLLNIIRESALKALEEYEQNGGPLPVIQSTDSHPLDRANNTLSLKKIIRTLEGACEQLCSTLASPTQTVLNRAQDYQWICMRVVVKHKIADELAKHASGVHINDLATTVNIHPKKLASVMRCLATKHCFQEVSPDVFTNNRLSLTLATTHPGSAIIMFSTDRYEYIQTLPEYLVDPEVGHSLNRTDAPFQYFIKGKDPNLRHMSYWQWIDQASNRERRVTFDKAMIAYNEVLGSLSGLEAYDWSGVKTVCDVGAGIGHFSRALLQEKREVHVTLFDLPATIEITKQHWNIDHLGRVSFVPGDFLEDIPVKNCDVYYMRSVLHNWGDEKATTILKNIRNAMGPTSRLLIHDPVLRPLSTTTHGDCRLDQAPEPLLPNYGAGNIQLHNLDMTMLSLHNAYERYPSDITTLSQTSGLRLLHVYDLSDSCILEFA